MYNSYKNIEFPPLEDFAPEQPVVKTLQNGLRVYFLEDNELPLVRVRASIRAGAAYEPAEKIGLASICAQVMRMGGTLKNPGDALDDELGLLGATLDISMGGVSAGASASCLAEKLLRVLDLFNDILRYPSFPQEKIDLAKSAMRTAISRRNDQIGTMAQRAHQIAMYGRASVFAREPQYATIDSITRDDLLQYHRQYFNASRAMIGFVGDFKTSDIWPTVENYFGNWEVSRAPLAAIDTNPLPVHGRSVYFSEKSDVNQTNLYISGVGTRRDDPDWPALRVASFVLGSGGFSSRLLRKVRTELGLAYSVGGGFGAEYDRVGLFRTACQTKTQSTAQAIEAMLGEIEGLIRNPPDRDEIASAQDQILNAEVFEYDTKPEVLARRMTLDYYNYPPAFLQDVNRRVRTITPESVAAAIRRKLNPENLKIVAVGNRDGFDKPLANFGPVTEIDLSILDK
ncbi:MAG: insulinase family protein [Planctomycetes bacterium]|nr:insulinase family protein [Planctomycetota bacterium]